MGGVEPGRVASSKASLDGLGNREHLGDAEADRDVEVHALERGLFDGGDAGRRGRQLHLHVGAQLCELDRLHQHRRTVVVQGRVGLHREPTPCAIICFEDRQHQLGAACAHLGVQLPGDGPLVVTGPSTNDLAGSRQPPIGLFAQHRETNDGVARRARRTALDGIRQICGCT